jgi:SAM-dependent methyltransferase
MLIRRAMIYPYFVAKVFSSAPLPPDELIDRVVSGFSNEKAEDHRALFLETGRLSLEDLEKALAGVGSSITDHKRILEFGCGCGRIMRWMERLGGAQTLVGTDIDERAIDWATHNLPFARFDVNSGLPPTRYGDDEFDLVINHSVFTHLDAEYQDRWLAELQRITSPDGLLVLSVHGEHAFQICEQQLDADSRESREWRKQLESHGILYVADDGYVGSAFPDFYHTAFHAPWYILEHWSRWFEVLGYLPRSSLGFQDQVVLRPVDSSLDASEARRPVRARPILSESSSVSPTEDTFKFSPRDVLQMPAGGSNFGSLGLLARRAIFRLARPVLYAQLDVDRSLAEAISMLDSRVGGASERMPQLVHVALVQQAERIGRLESELQELRHTVATDRRE